MTSRGPVPGDPVGGGNGGEVHEGARGVGARIERHEAARSEVQSAAPAAHPRLGRVAELPATIRRDERPRDGRGPDTDEQQERGPERHPDPAEDAQDEPDGALATPHREHAEGEREKGRAQDLNPEPHEGERGGEKERDRNARGPPVREERRERRRDGEEEERPSRAQRESRPLPRGRGESHDPHRALRVGGDPEGARAEPRENVELADRARRAE